MLESPLPQLDRLFDYRVPPALVAAARPGVRVKVPLRSAGRTARGYIIEVVAHADYQGSLSEIDEIVSPLPVLTPEVWALARRLADRAAGSACDIVRLAVPPRFVRVEKAFLARRAGVAPVSGSEVAAEDAAKGGAGAEGEGADGDARDGAKRDGTDDVADGGARDGADDGARDSVDDGARDGADGGARDGSDPRDRADARQSADDSARDSAGGGAAVSAAADTGTLRLTAYSAGDAGHLMEPGSRSAIDAVATVVAVRDAEGAEHTVGHWALTVAEFAAAVFRGGESVIVAVPDYRDQTSLEQALAHAGVADAVVPLDARQARTDRYANFLTALDGEPHIVVGNRSSVYAPVSNLGLIVVWDEGDSLQTEPLAPYVHVRDAALVRQEQSGCRLSFVSHSRSTEVERLVELAFLHPVFPTPRYLPRVVPTAEQDDADAPQNSARIPSSAWAVARAALETGPVLVQVARPGYAPVLACTNCATPAACTVCGGPLKVARAGARPSCSLCGAIAANWSCATCQGTTFRFASIGAGRTADELGRAFPGTRVIVSDGERPVLTVDARPALVVATRGAEPIATGGYRAVLLLDGPRMLARESLRVAEDCLRWWSNAIALSAPRATNVLVGVGGELAKSLVTWQQESVAGAELVDRRRLRFPPAVRIATVTGAADTVETAMNDLHGLLTDAEWAKMDTLGPVPTDDGSVRVIVRFDYSIGTAVARHLRALVVKNATSRRAKAGRGAAYRPPPTLRVRLDDSEIME
ncbi:primosomal protein N' [Herbiconiux sp. CPCC 203386]|uniref:Primosomal protein N n=2 Tax=Herbiconiux daphne TaxID=2970914 RepID=A0ABT2GZ76_9MICO|nr:primosomal protein N' [Herbiconiux daphne]MCS5733268.1 primosomal protein N' [Herbiconiux daphne]